MAAVLRVVELGRAVREEAKLKVRQPLAKLVVAQGFFWDGEKGNQADAKKSGIDNLAQAIGLAGKQPVGWEML